MTAMSPMQLWCRIFMGKAQRKLFRHGVPVFTYHSVGNPKAGARDPYLYVTSDEFIRQLDLLQADGFTAGSLDEAIAATGNPGRKFVITFDDGYCNVFENALPVLERYRFRAVQFIVANLIGGRNEWMLRKSDIPEPLMDRHQIQEWLACGHEIGSHSLNHPQLAKIPLTQARKEIVASKKRLEDLFSIPIRHFCYPSGSWNEAVRDLVAEAGYDTACTTAFGVNTVTTPRHSLHRVVPLSREELIGKIQHRLKRRLQKSRFTRL
jgi:peptidoglycan/xylan/chitin deacetylase (PgdA/CDA1 family)